MREKRSDPRTLTRSRAENQKTYVVQQQYPVQRYGVKGLLRSVLEHALKLASAGKPVFPCDPVTKKPLVGGGFKSATTDKKQIRAWWAKWPDAMIGMPAGAASGGWVLDIDVAKNGEAVSGHVSLAALVAKHGPHGFCRLSGGDLEGCQHFATAGGGI